jgi:putative RecB family exonuclease
VRQKGAVKLMPVYSHSRLETFETCPQKYKYRYIDKIVKPEEQTVEAFVGSRVHETLQKLYKDLQLTKLISLNALIDYYAEQWKANWSPAIKIVREGYTEQNYFDYGVQCVRNYYAQYSPFDQSQTLRMEARIVFPLDGDKKYQIQGYIDRVARRTDGTYEIHDYKTSQTLPSQTVVNTDRQLALYQIGLATPWPDVEHVELIWHFVGFSTTLRSARQPEELRQLRESTIKLIERIELEKEFVPNKSRLYDWCEYRSDCPLWRHVEYVDTLTPEQLKTDDGVHLVDEYARAKADLTHLQSRIDQLKEQLALFAQQ